MTLNHGDLPGSSMRRMVHVSHAICFREELIPSSRKKHHATFNHAGRTSATKTWLQPQQIEPKRLRYGHGRTSPHPEKLT